MGSKMLVLFALLFVHYANGEDAPVVTTQNGAVRGSYNYTAWDNSTKFSSFTNMPYAKPPVGALRFKPPLPAESWEGTLDATEEPTPCPQSDILSQRLMGREDCLKINVYTPYTNFSESMTLKPVMVWIYGGAFLTGYSNYTFYGPYYLMRHDVVVVSLNYRVGALGFLCVDDPRVSCNVGLKDQYLALQWVQKNIAAFGGDPKQVTIFGQSAGAVSTNYHVLAEQAAGLFSKAILMSGTSLVPWAHLTRLEAHNNARLLALRLGHLGITTKDIVDKLLAADAIEIAIATNELNVISPIPFRPCIENKLTDPTAYVTDCSMNKFATGNFNRVPIMLGYTENEALSFLYIVNRMAGNATDIIDYVGKINPVANNALSTLVKDTAVLTIYDAAKLASIVLFDSPIDMTQKALAKYVPTGVYFYHQSFYTSNVFHKVYAGMHIEGGCAHLDDIPYIWQLRDMYSPPNPDDPEHKHIVKMSTAWTNFAKYGDPTPEGNNPLDIIWKQSEEEGFQIDMNYTFTMNGRMLHPLGYPVQPILSVICEA